MSGLYSIPQVGIRQVFRHQIGENAKLRKMQSKSDRFFLFVKFFVKFATVTQSGLPSSEAKTCSGRKHPGTYLPGQLNASTAQHTISTAKHTREESMG